MAGCILLNLLRNTQRFWRVGKNRKFYILCKHTKYAAYYTYGKDFMSLGFHLLLTSQSNDKL